MLCQKIIPLSKSSNTYCTLTEGHAEECSIATEVISRKESELIPEGVSCTETEVAYYLRVRQGTEIVCMRVTKKLLYVEVTNTHVQN
jgi:hypothetical protein